MKKSIGSIAIGLAVAATVAIALTGCSSVSTPTGMCGWVVGNGEAGNDAKIHDTVYPDESVTLNTGEEAHYVPCGPRNFLITDGSVAGLGDQVTPIEAVTSDNTPVLVQVDAFWQLNQGKDGLDKFAELCNKYDCYTSDAVAGSSNFASDGWNGMLRENFSPAITDAMQTAMKQIPDSIWKTKDAAEEAKLNELLSAAFMESIRVRTGYNVDLFCGSGNSGWSDPEKPGEKDNKFTCTNVRFDVTSTEPRDKTTRTNANAQNQLQLDTEANQARYSKSVPLYGDQTHFWLGVQDATSKCPEGSTCNIYLGTAAK